MSTLPNPPELRHMAGENAQRRADFLMKMYAEMWGNINRHILVVWQSVSVLAATFAAFAVAERKIIPVDVPISIVILAAAWLIAHCIDANLWYNRNLAIIANIERQFLDTRDLRLIHPYFGQHRRPSLLGHFRIQMILGIAVAALAILYHVIDRVVPGIGGPWSSFDPVRTIPYIAAITAARVLYRFHLKEKKRYEDFLRDSPGASIEETS